MIVEILASRRACTEADPERPGVWFFRADAIVANPQAATFTAPRAAPRCT